MEKFTEKVRPTIVIQVLIVILLPIILFSDSEFIQNLISCILSFISNTLNK